MIDFLKLLLFYLFYCIVSYAFHLHLNMRSTLALYIIVIFSLVLYAVTHVKLVIFFFLLYPCFKFVCMFYMYIVFVYLV